VTEAATEWVPTGVDEEVPSAARVYDYLLGGGHNFSADRVLAENLLKVLPARDMARLNRQYLDRAVRYMIGKGITQFLDLGSGIPTVGNVHEVAQKVKPGARVVLRRQRVRRGRAQRTDTARQPERSRDPGRHA
jgi:hypothetical protein